MKSASATVTLRLPVQQKKRLRKLADATKRSASFIAADAIGRYLDEQEEYEKSIEQGRAEIRAGLYLPQEEVEKWLLTLGTKDEVDIDVLIARDKAKRGHGKRTKK